MPPKRDYPIPVEDFSGGEAGTLGCPGCGFSRDAIGDEIGAYSEPEFHLSCPRCGEGLMWKYEIADKCPGCGRLGWWHSAYADNTCSRRCHLEVEYLRELEAKSAA